MTKRLLVADDSVTIQKVVSLTFAGEDVVIEAVSSGDRALETARAFHPDIVLADVFMPGLSGYEVCSGIKRDPELAGIPVILLVGTFEPFDEGEAARVGSDGHLTKPFDTSELIEVVRSLIGREGRSPDPVPMQVRAAASSAIAAGAIQEPLVSARARESFLGDGRILDVIAPQLLEAAAAPQIPEATPAAAPKPIEPPPASPAPEEPYVPQMAAEDAAAKPKLMAAPQVIPFPGARQLDSSTEGVELPEEIMRLIVERVVRRMSPDVIRDVAWEVIPELAEIIIRQVLNEKGIGSSARSEEPLK